MTYLSSLIKTAMHSMLTRRYLLVTLMISLSVLVAIYCIALQVVYSSVEQQIEYRDNLMSETLSRVLTLKIENIISDLKLLSGYGLSTSDDQREFYIEQMQKDVVDVPLYTSIQLFDKHGHVILNAPFTSKRRYIPFPNINYRLSWSKTYFISQLLRLPDGSYTIAVAYPTISSNGSYEGGAIAYINLNVLSQELDDYTIGAQGENLVVDGNGRIIADSSSKEMAASISQTDIGQNLAKYRYGIIRTDLFHNKVVATYRPLDVADFGLIVSEPVVQATAPVAHVAKLLSEGFIIILLLASVLTVVGTTRVVKPILDLTRQADEYRKNQLYSFSRIKTGDELETLSITLENMASSLTRKERRLFHILESIPYAIITTDPSGTVWSFNRAAEDLTLFSRTEIIGKNVVHIPFSENLIETVIWKTLAEGNQFDEKDTYILDKDGNKREVVVHSSVFRGLDNEVGVILIMRDVSEFRRLQRYLKQNERLASLGRLTASIAHEIKNPLSIIQAAAEAIQLEIADSQLEVSELAADILETSNRMNLLLGDFLALSRDGETEPRESINLTSVLDDLIMLLRNTLKQHNITLSRQYPVRAPIIQAVKNRIIQSFLNILMNSIEAMPKGGEIQILIAEQSQSWMIEIKDTGDGIPAAQLPWIFDPFYSTKSNGTGLGLSISNEIINQHGGSMWANSTEGKGTTIFIQLPKNYEGVTQDENAFAH